MRLLISGAKGLIGSRLIPLLEQDKHTVIPLPRNHFNPKELEGFEAVIHLAGEPIANKRWTAAVKKKIYESRVHNTTLLANVLTQLQNPPRIFICASAIGYYGDRGEELLTEASPAGSGFLSEACKAWESACDPLRQKGIRVVQLRTGIVLTPDGGALKAMLPFFKLGIAGCLGDGNQYMSWIALEDELKAIRHCLLTTTIQGPVNLVAPNPVHNCEFTKTLGKILHRPTIFALPRFAARFIFGEKADALLLASTRVVPAVLESSGFKFTYPLLESALARINAH